MLPSNLSYDKYYRIQSFYNSTDNDELFSVYKTHPFLPFEQKHIADDFINKINSKHNVQYFQQFSYLRDPYNFVYTRKPCEITFYLDPCLKNKDWFILHVFCYHINIYEKKEILHYIFNYTYIEIDEKLSKFAFKSIPKSKRSKNLFRLPDSKNVLKYKFANYETFLAFCTEYKGNKFEIILDNKTIAGNVKNDLIETNLTDTGFVLYSSTPPDEKKQSIQWECKTEHTFYVLPLEINLNDKFIEWINPTNPPLSDKIKIIR